MEAVMRMMLIIGIFFALGGALAAACLADDLNMQIQFTNEGPILSPDVGHALIVDESRVQLDTIDTRLCHVNDRTVNGRTSTDKFGWGMILVTRDSGATHKPWTVDQVYELALQVCEKQLLIRLGLPSS